MQKLPMHAMIKIILNLLFASVLASAAYADGNYRIRAGDTLSIEVLEDPTLNRNVLVLPDGTVTFPLVGTLRAGGASIDTVRANLTSALASNFAAPPTVFVSVAALAERNEVASELVPVTIDTYIMGEVNAPGRIAVIPGTTILQILAEAGGFTRFAAPKRVQLRRADKNTGDMRTYIFNYQGTGGGQSIKGSTTLEAGDVVVVPQRRLFE